MGEIWNTESSKIVWKADYTPFGEATVDPTSTITNNLRFPGQIYDEETGLHYNNFRDYDPNIGRYIESDPIGLLAETNIYTYVRSNPISWTDPLGLLPPNWAHNNLNHDNGANFNLYGGGGFFGSASAGPFGGSGSFGTFNDDGRTCSFIQSCRRYTLGAQAALGFSFTAGVRDGPLCSGTFTTYSFFAGGDALSVIGRASVGLSKKGVSITGAYARGKSALPAFVGFEVCEITLKCQKPEPCECSSR